MVTASVEELKKEPYEYFENIIKQLIEKYKNDTNRVNWYAAIGDNCDGKTNENFISIGMINNDGKIVFSRVRIPKTELGKMLIEKFMKSYWVDGGGIKEINVVKAKGESLNTIGYFRTNKGGYFEILTVKPDLIVDGISVDLDYFGNWAKENLSNKYEENYRLNWLNENLLNNDILNNDKGRHV